jgi:hypothetical protein
MSAPDPRDDDSAFTELLIQPDGRVFVFGLSRPVLEVLGTLTTNDRRLRELLGRTKSETVEETQ